MPRLKPFQTIQLPICLLSILFILSCNNKNKVLTKHDFVKIFADSVKKRIPKAEIIFNPDGTLIIKYKKKEDKFFPDNTYLTYSANPDSINAIINKALAITEDVFSDHNDVKSENIVPIIKPIEFLNLGITDHPEGKLSMIYKRYNDQLIIAYAENTENSLDFLMDSAFLKLGISKDSLYTLALKNLDRALPEVKKKGQDGLYMITAGGNFEASLILLSFPWKKDVLDVKGDFVIAIPNRDVLLVTGSADKKNIDKLKNISAERYKNGDHQVSEYLYKWDGKKFEKFD